jgi:hypothetical protein
MTLTDSIFFLGDTRIAPHEILPRDYVASHRRFIAQLISRDNLTK